MGDKDWKTRLNVTYVFDYLVTLNADYVSKA